MGVYLERKALQLVDVGGEHIEAEHTLDRGLDPVEVPGDHEPHSESECHAADPDQATLDREHAQDPVVLTPHRLQDRDVA